MELPTSEEERGSSIQLWGAWQLHHIRTGCTENKAGKTGANAALSSSQEYTLKRDSAVELHRSAANRGASDLSRLPVADGIIARLSKTGMVEHVGRVSPNLELDAALRPHIEYLPQREIHIGKARPILAVSAEIAVCERIRDGKSAQVIPLIETIFCAA